MERYTALSRCSGEAASIKCRESVLGDDISLALGQSTHSQLRHIQAGARVRGLALWPYQNQRKGEMKTGLWAYFRYLNYFGEWLFRQGWRSSAYSGVLMMVDATGAVAMLAMFLLASIPMIDKKVWSCDPRMLSVCNRF